MRLDTVQTERGTFVVPTERSTPSFNTKVRAGGFELEKLDWFMHYATKHYGPRAGPFIDVGAHIGTTAIPVAMMGHEVIAIEPDPLLVACLAAGAWLSGVEHKVHINQAAAHSDTENVTLQLNPHHAGDNRIKGPANPDAEKWESIEVRTVVLNDCIDLPGWMWIDAQGHEAHVLDGGSVYVGRVPLFMEFFPPHMSEPSHLFETLQAAYRHFIEYGTDLVRPTSHLPTLYAEMVAKVKKTPNIHTDLFFIG